MNGETSKKHKFTEDAGMTFQQVYDFAYKGVGWLGCIPLLKSLANELGQERLIEVLKRAASEAATQGGRNRARNAPNNDFAFFTAWAKDPPRFWKHVRTHEVVEHTDRALELRVTECLWAKTFREGGASELGYAAICYPEHALCQAFNSKIRLIRTKTLMQGDDCCDHCWVWEE